MMHFWHYEYLVFALFFIDDIFCIHHFCSQDFFRFAIDKTSPTQ